MDVKEISFDDFVKVDIRVGSVLEAARVPKSDKLLQLKVSFGELGTRTILAGIGKDYDPIVLIGTQIMAVVNLAPRKMMGIESHGMIMASRLPDGQLSLAGCSGVVDGSRIG